MIALVASDKSRTTFLSARLEKYLQHDDEFLEHQHFQVISPKTKRATSLIEAVATFAGRLKIVEGESDKIRVFLVASEMNSTRIACAKVTSFGVVDISESPARKVPLRLW